MMDKHGQREVVKACGGLSNGCCVSSTAQKTNQKQSRRPTRRHWIASPKLLRRPRAGGGCLCTVVQADWRRAGGPCESTDDGQTPDGGSVLLHPPYRGARRYARDSGPLGARPSDIPMHAPESPRHGLLLSSDG